jgi:predicted RNA-binding Zn-ribbon protein involved in translation (DUF1610 family)
MPTLVEHVKCKGCGWIGELDDVIVESGHHCYRCPKCGSANLILNPEVNG